MYLLQYKFEIKYRKGLENGNADGISRIPVAMIEQDFMSRLKEEQEKDQELQRLQLKSGEIINGFYKDEDGIIYFKSNIGTEEEGKKVVPASMRQEVMEANHDYLLAGHGGIVKTYEKIRSGKTCTEMSLNIATAADCALGKKMHI